MIRSKLSEILGKRKMKMTDVAQLTDLSWNTISDVYWDKRGTTLSTIDKLCEVLGVNVGDLLEYVPDEEAEVISPKPKKRTNKNASQSDIGEP